MSSRLAAIALALGFLIAVVLSCLWLTVTPARAAGEPVLNVWQWKLTAEKLAEQNERLRAHNRNYGQWVRKLRRENQLVRRQARVGYQVAIALDLACAAFPRVSCPTLKRKARCESKLWPFAWNPTPVSGEHATGLMQFLPSTFRSTPFGRLPIYDPYVNAMTGAWMHHAGRGGEWACR